MPLALAVGDDETNEHRIQSAKILTVVQREHIRIRQLLWAKDHSIVVKKSAY
ncbi:MAG: hypothetical protein RMK18_07630 [Armatimonadota bacterium]|nr:hypothetical protein [Armatimonadota bacterium]MCX7776672.1 hypothetical protein [Armatimonadota bacterium]MDW8025713.1 hypothetical protein [Armatimonadota bacterium]